MTRPNTNLRRMPPGRRRTDTAGRRKRLRIRQRDRGAATTELVIAMPLLLFIILLIVHTGVWMHATHVAQAAATRAANTAAAYHASATDGHDAGTTTFAAIGDDVLDHPTVTVTRTATDVRVEIVAEAAPVVPGMRWTVRAVVVRPVERFVPEDTSPAGAP